MKIKILSVLFILFGTLAATDAEAARFSYPKWNGYALDWCRTFGTNCGKPAADLFCQKKGYPQATGFQIWSAVQFQTMTIGQNAICDGANRHCDSFLYIDCQESSFHTFSYPTYNGYRLDWCRLFETECGHPAALAYCRRSGFSGVLNFAKQGPLSTPTMTIGSNAICNPSFHSCDSFSFIRCRR